MQKSAAYKLGRALAKQATTYKERGLARRAVGGGARGAIGGAALGAAIGAAGDVIAGPRLRAVKESA